jgi:Rhodopirellula transposase DDE domain
VCHVPPGTSKGHKLEQRLCCHSTEHWRGRPRVRHQVSVNLMAHTTPATGLCGEAALDPTSSPTGNKVADDERAHVN